MIVDKGAALNRRVWQLFTKAGFTTQPNASDPAEKSVELKGRKSKRTLDLFAADDELGISIIGWNKSRNRLTESFSTYVNDCEVIRKNLKANASLFVSTETEILDDDREFARQNNGTVWGLDELEYYEAIAAAIGPWARYEIIHSLHIQTREEKPKLTVPAIRLNQPSSKSTTELFSFSLPADKLLKTCAIFRRAQGDATAYQRMLGAKRLPGVAKFLSESDSILPTNVVLHLSSKVNVHNLKNADKFRDEHGAQVEFSRSDAHLVALDIPLEYASMEIIDGQHRIFGFSQCSEKVNKNYSVFVTGLRNLDEVRKRDTFIAINDNSRRMDANLVAYLKYTKDDVLCQADNELMAIRVVVELNQATPFKKAIRLLDIGDQRVTLKGFAGYDLKGLLGPRGLLRKYYVANTAAEYTTALRTYFSTIQSMFKKEWNDPDRYIIATNRGISAFLKLLKSMLRTHNGTLDHDTIKKYLTPLKTEWKTWEISELKGNYTASQGWKKFHRDLVAAIRKQDPTFQE